MPRCGIRGKREHGNWTNRMVDPTPDEIAAWKAAQPIRTFAGSQYDPNGNNAPFYQWLYDPDNVAPLHVAVPE